MTPEQRILKEIDDIAKRAMKKRKCSEFGGLGQITLKKKVKFYGMAQDKN